MRMWGTFARGPRVTDQGATTDKHVFQKSASEMATTKYNLYFNTLGRLFTDIYMV